MEEPPDQRRHKIILVLTMLCVWVSVPIIIYKSRAAAKVYQYGMMSIHFKTEQKLIIFVRNIHSINIIKV
jgi:hypothetical protein